MRAARSLLSIAAVALVAAVWLATRAPDDAAVPGARAPAAGADPAGAPARAEPPAGRSERAEVVAPAAPLGYQVELLSADGAPVADAAVFVGAESWRAEASDGDAHGSEARTGADGRARFDGAAPDWRCIAIDAPGHAPIWRRRTVEAGVETLRLPPDVAVDGSVTIDGAEPPAPIELELRGFALPADGWPEAAASWLGAKSDRAGSLRAKTGDRGAFAFRGLAGGIALRLLGPTGYRLPGAASLRPELEVTTPQRGLRLAFESLPVIRGRIVGQIAEPAGDAVVTIGGNLLTGIGWAQPHLTLHYRFVRSGGVREDRLFLSPGARFTLPFHETDVARFELDVFAGITFLDGELLARRRIDGPLRQSHDLGDIDVREGERALVVEVVDPDGAPIAGALAAAGGRLSGETDARGLVAMTCSAAARTLTVGAFGYCVTRVPIPAARSTTIRVTLPRANRLRFVVVAPGPEALVGLQLRTELPGEPGEDAPEWVAGFAGVHGPPPSGGERSAFVDPSGRRGGSHAQQYSLPADGRIELCDLPVGIAFRVALQDAHGHRLWSEELTLAAGELRELRHSLQTGPRRLRARVADANGAAVPNASVTAGHQPLALEAGGWFELDHVHGPSPAIRVDAPGRVGRDLEPGFLDRETTILLEPARVLWVELHDAAGGRPQAQVIYRGDAGDAVGAAHSEPGLVRLDGVPLRPGKLELRRDGSPSAELHPVSATETRVRVVLR
jgi:hypothetical protein